MKSITIAFALFAMTSATPVEVLLSPFRAARSLHPSPSYELTVRAANGQTLKQLKVYPSRTAVFQPGMQYMELSNTGARYKTPKDKELKQIHDNLYSDGKASLLIQNGKVSGVLDHEHSIKAFSHGHTLHPISRDMGSPSERFSDVVNLNLNSTPSIGGLSDDPIKVEVWVVLDYDFAKQFNFDQSKILNYLGPFFHGINTRYAAAASDWDVQFLVAGVTVVKDKSQQPWMEQNSVGSGMYDIGGTLDSFAIAVDGGKLPKSDLVALLTNTEMTSDGSTGVAGLAFLGGVCRTNGGQGYIGTSVTEDRYAYYGGVHSVTHEFGHNMGAPHDGNRDGDSPASAPCSWDDGYIMSYKTENPNHFHFSQCSKDLIREVIGSREAECIRAKDVPSPVIEDPNSKSLPGALMTMDEACRRKTQNPNAKVYIDDSKPTSAQCQQLWCLIGNSASSSGAPEEGTACGNGGVCTAGICVGDE